MGRAVVQHDVNVLAWCDDRAELVEEGGERRRVVAGDDLGEDLAGGHVHRGDQRGGAVAGYSNSSRTGRPGATGRPG
ncbi:hypothetical protein [Streptomyces sp. NPDC057909]|uniref:hypothetical protein n=1 Tax=Streptomyces sp. NPDC057909 TaxID=3346277 RepID=UPI0036E04705